MNWLPTPTQRTVLVIAGAALLYHAFERWSDDRSATLPILAGALVLTASLAGSSRIESIAGSIWRGIVRHWKALFALLLATGIVLGGNAYRNEVVHSADMKRIEAEFAVTQKAEQAIVELKRQKIKAKFEACVKANPVEVGKQRDGTLDPEVSAFWIKYGEDRCVYIRDSEEQKIDPLTAAIRAEHNR